MALLPRNVLISVTTSILVRPALPPLSRSKESIQAMLTASPSPEKIYIVLKKQIRLTPPVLRGRFPETNTGIFLRKPAPAGKLHILKTKTLAKNLWKQLVISLKTNAKPIFTRIIPAIPESAVSAASILP